MKTKSAYAKEMIRERRIILVILLVSAIGWTVCSLIGSQGFAIITELKARRYSVSGGTLIDVENRDRDTGRRLSSFGPFIFFRRNVFAYRKNISKEDAELISRLPYVESVYVRSSNVTKLGLESIVLTAQLKN